MKIDLAGTSLETKSFAPVARNVDPEEMARIAGGLEPDRCDRGGDWMLCATKNEVFEGAGDPEKLQTTLETFSNWRLTNSSEQGALPDRRQCYLERRRVSADARHETQD